MQMQLLREITAAQDRASFERALVSFGHFLGFELSSAGMAIERNLAPAQFAMVGNVPAGWKTNSQDPDFVRRDPVVKLLKSRPQPFVYDQDLYVDAGAGDMWEAMAPYGYRTGIAVATHLPGGKHFLLGVDRTRPLPAVEDDLARLMADLHLFSAYAQTAAERCLFGSVEPSEATPTLEPRDADILKWAAAGKSTWAIGQLMNLSESVVRRRIDKVRATLGVATRQQAVARAVGLGLVKP